MFKKVIILNVTEANNTIATLQSDNDAKTKKIAELEQLLGL